MCAHVTLTDPVCTAPKLLHVPITVTICQPLTLCAQRPDEGHVRLKVQQHEAVPLGDRLGGAPQVLGKPRWGAGAVTEGSWLVGGSRGSEGSTNGLGGMGWKQHEAAPLGDRLGSAPQVLGQPRWGAEAVWAEVRGEVVGAGPCK